MRHRSVALSDKWKPRWVTATDQRENRLWRLPIACSVLEVHAHFPFRYSWKKKDKATSIITSKLKDYFNFEVIKRRIKFRSERLDEINSECCDPAVRIKDFTQEQFIVDIPLLGRSCPDATLRMELAKLGHPALLFARSALVLQFTFLGHRLLSDSIELGMSFWTHFASNTTYSFSWFDIRKRGCFGPLRREVVLRCESLGVLSDVFCEFHRH